MSSIRENVNDRLSMLPDEILSDILSLIPTKFAVRTSILSKRWRYTWTLVTNLDFDDTHGRLFCENIFTEFVDRVFKFCKRSHVNSFRLHISKYKVPGSCISNWIDNAVKLNVRELDICVIHPEFPLSLFTCKTLTNLRLDPSDIVYKVWEFPSSIYLPCMKTLDITGCYNPCMFILIHGCPVLESLSLEISCNDEEKDCVFNIPTLKRLKLKYRSAFKTVSNKIVLRVPELEYLFVGGLLFSLFVMEDVSSLVGASIECWIGTNNYLWRDLLNKLRGVQNLSIQNFPFPSSLPIFPNMKQLELNGEWQSGHITQFLDSCTELKILCLDYIAGRKVFKKPAESSWTEYEPKLLPTCMITNLTTIKFSNWEGNASDMEFLEYMLGNAKVLKAVTMFVGVESLIKEDARFGAQVLKLPRASPHCEIHFRPWKLPQYTMGS